MHIPHCVSLVRSALAVAWGEVGSDVGWRLRMLEAACCIFRNFVGIDQGVGITHVQLVGDDRPVTPCAMLSRLNSCEIDPAPHGKVLL
jgi:hypothetical protein